MTSHRLRPLIPLVIVITTGLLICSGCAGATHHAVMGATPEHISSHASDEPEPSVDTPAESPSLFAHMPSLSFSPFFDAQSSETAPLADWLERVSPLQILGAIPLLLGLGLVFGALPTLPARNSRDFVERSGGLSAALKLLSPGALALRSAQRYPTSDGSLTASEAEFLRRAAERIDRARAAEWRRAEGPLSPPGPEAVEGHS